MDEPCSALDPTSTRRIEETIAELRLDSDDRDRHPQHAAGRSRLAAGGLLPRRAGHARAASSKAVRPPSCSATRADPRTADYVNGRFRMTVTDGVSPPAWRRSGGGCRAHLASRP